MMPRQRTAEGTGSSSREQNSSNAFAGASAVPAVCKALSKRCQHSPTFPKISTILFRKKKAFAFEIRRISHAVRTSDLLRCGGRPPHFGSADARQELQHEFRCREGNRGARGRHLPCLSAGRGRFMDATALSGDG